MYPPNVKLDRVAGPAVEPLSLADAKAYLRVETDAEDDLIADLIAAARLECERINDRSFITTTWRFTLDDLPFSGSNLGSFALPWARYGFGGVGRVDADDGGITLPMPPLVEVTSFTYVDQGGTIRPIDVSPGAGLVIVSAGTPGRIYPAYGTFFPFSQPRPAAVEVTYTAGYGDDPPSVPRSIVMAIRLLTAHYHKHRTSNAEVPDAVANLLASTAWGGYA